MKVLALTALAALFFAAGPADATVYDFTQGGYMDGATAYGSFTGSDLNGDGVIESFLGPAGGYYPDEVTDFTFHFSGDASIPPFALTFGNLAGLVYDLDGTLGDTGSEGIEAGYMEGLPGEGDDGMRSGGTPPIGPDRYWHVAAMYGLCNGVHLCSSADDSDNGAEDVTAQPLIVTAAVPEPAIWAMFIAGFGLIGTVMRRRPALAVV